MDIIKRDVDHALQLSANAFQVYGKTNLIERASFMRSIATEISLHEKELISVASEETHLNASRLTVELQRTIFQLTSYADACEEGTWLDIRIDTAIQNRNPSRPDIRKILVPLGPVVVFGASNFPFAYSTAGGDTACALAAGCTVIVKAHPAHTQTSEMVAACIQKAAIACRLPEGVFIHLSGNSFETGIALVEHPLTKAVGFTGSLEGGRALFNVAAQRKEPIAVFAEMGSVNPAFLFPEKLKREAAHFSQLFAGSVTQSSGQFCTKPGVLVGIKSAGLENFKELLAEAIKKVPPAFMLHEGIAKSFLLKRNQALNTAGVDVVAQTEIDEAGESIPTLVCISTELFLNQLHLQHEVFGPFTVLVECENENEMYQVATILEGQLTCTVIATDEEIYANEKLLDTLKSKCGRFILNGIPTGVEVVLSMQHGGPFPATTDSRFTAVGADGIKRFARPICFQNWQNQFLPDELKDENPNGLWRTVNNTLTREAIK
ncbi:MAG: aldehyde dehydrogenase (NADP(+)) [Flavisolibacter sp.]